MNKSIIEKVIIERNKSVDSAVMMEIQKIAVENGIETKFILNEKNILVALKKQIPERYELWNGQCCCPNCKKMFGPSLQLNLLRYWGMPYCKFCGQALIWDDLSTEKGGEADA